MSEIIKNGLSDKHFEIHENGVSPDLEAQSVVVRVSAKQFWEVNFGYGQDAVFLYTPTSGEEAAMRERLSMLYETREERITRSLLHFQREKVNHAIEQGRDVIFRYIT